MQKLSSSGCLRLLDTYAAKSDAPPCTFPFLTLLIDHFKVNRILHVVLKDGLAAQILILGKHVRFLCFAVTLRLPHRYAVKSYSPCMFPSVILLLDHFKKSGEMYLFTNTLKDSLVAK